MLWLEWERCSSAMSAQTLQLGIERRVKEVFPEHSSMSIKQEIYLGNPNLKKANVSTQFTKKQVAEYLKCAEDPIYFIRTYIRIVSLDEGVIPFDMYDFQEEMVGKFHQHRFNIAKLPRQSGKSTIVTAYLLWYVLFNDNVNVAILANKAPTAREMLGRLQLSYENLPKWLQQGILGWNKGSLELENGSKILASSTSASAVRGMSFNIIFLDEFAFVPNHIAEQFFASVYPTISSGKKTKVIIISTPHGMNQFYKLWHDAERGANNYVATEVHWSQVLAEMLNGNNKLLRIHLKHSSELSLTVSS